MRNSGGTSSSSKRTGQIDRVDPAGLGRQPLQRPQAAVQQQGTEQDRHHHGDDRRQDHPLAIGHDHPHLADRRVGGNDFDGIAAAGGAGGDGKPMQRGAIGQTDGPYIGRRRGLVDGDGGEVRHRQAAGVDANEGQGASPAKQQHVAFGAQHAFKQHRAGHQIADALHLGKKWRQAADVGRCAR